MGIASARPHDGARRARRAGRVVATGALSAVLLVTGSPAALAAPGDDAVPSRDEVEDAEARVAEKRSDVGAIQAALVMANQRLEAAAVRAEQASEAYNGAMWRLDLARREVATARREAAEARRTLAEQRRSIGALVAATYQQASQLTVAGALMGADGPEGVLDQYATFQGAADSLQADYDRYAATETLAEVFAARAVSARADQRRAADEAAAAKDTAVRAAGAAQAAAVAIAAEKERLIAQLAEAQDISVSLARARQTALEERARERAAARAEAAAVAAAQEAARQQAREYAAARRRARAAARSAAEAERTRAEGRRPRRENRRGDRDSGRGTPAPAPAPTAPKPAAPKPAVPRPAPPAPAPADSPQTTTPRPVSPPPAPAPPRPAPRGSGGADRVIAFAKAQVGEPYAWGAAGPDAWDCSGLMLAAWREAGVSLPHYSVAQYHAGSPIPAGDLRPGDLVFWGSTNNPDSIHHVALYIGNGQIVHAPRTGRPVSVEGLYYWKAPNFFVRL